MPTPIIFFHYGNPQYLKYSLKQARYFNPDSPIYLLGDKKNNRYPFVIHVSSDKYRAKAQAFIDRYKHRSSNNESYELNCFLRWFYIKAFCEENGIESFIYLDSDVLLFQDVSKLVPLFNNCNIANTCDDTGMPAFTYFKDQKVLNDFCEYLLHAYTDSKLVNELDALYQPFIDDGQMGGICDMTLFHFYFRDHPAGTLKIDMVGDDIAVDSNINRQDGYEVEDGIKKIYWKDKLPYAKNLKSGRMIRFATLHYQGTAKNAMRQHYMAGGYQLAKFLETLDLKGKLKRTKKAIKRSFKKSV
ncbi:MAG: hypothetical protein JWR50_1622 [Mucilaginibacter sp.]|nr:hypothetical protein [Mucilaginibacter sp.]